MFERFRGMKLEVLAFCLMQRMKNWLGAVAVASGLVFVPSAPAAKDGSSALALAKELNKAFIEVAENVSPSVVVIQVWHKPGYEDIDEENPLWEFIPPQWRRELQEERERQKQSPPGTPSQREADGQGSGIIIREDGYILTNRHVVEDTDRIRVRLKNGKYYPAEIKGVDVQSDIAVIKINAKGLTVATLGDSSQTKVGEFAIAIGAPFDLDYSVTYGHVSAKGRSDVLPRMRTGTGMDQDFVQTDASINPGNSGGPLVNLYGEVIGVNTLIRGLNTGIGFAIPSNLAKEVSDRLIADGKYRRSWLGVAIGAVEDDLDYQEMLPEGTEGVVVREILYQGPTWKSDLKPGDVITRVNGQAVKSANQLKAAIRTKPIGEAVSLQLVRLDGTRHANDLTVKVKTDEWPEASKPIPIKETTSRETETANLGLKVHTFTRELAEQSGVEFTPGAVVTSVEQNSLARRKGIRRGDIITELNQQPVHNAKQFTDALKNANLKKGMTLTLLSERNARFLILKDSGD
jgi:Do/DeqQ family serine protease